VSGDLANGMLYDAEVGPSRNRVAKKQCGAGGGREPALIQGTPHARRAAAFEYLAKPSVL